MLLGTVEPAIKIENDLTIINPHCAIRGSLPVIQSVQTLTNDQYTGFNLQEPITSSPAPVALLPLPEATINTGVPKFGIYHAPLLSLPEATLDTGVSKNSINHTLQVSTNKFDSLQGITTHGLPSQLLPASPVVTANHALTDKEQPYHCPQMIMTHDKRQQNVCPLDHHH